MTTKLSIKKSKITRNLIYYYLIMLVTLLVIPSGNGTITNNYFLYIRMDHYIHATLFLPMIPLLYMHRKKRIMETILIGLAFGIAAEMIHLFIPYRTFSISDILANTTGTFLGIIIYKIYLKVH